MSLKRFLLIAGILFALSIIWNGVVHLLVIASVDEVVSHLRRPDFAQKIWMSCAGTTGIAYLFTFGLLRVADPSRMTHGIMYGFLFGCLAGLLVDLNQYVIYPIPGYVAWTWFAVGMIEFVLYGMIASLLCKKLQNGPNQALQTTPMTRGEI